MQLTKVALAFSRALSRIWHRTATTRYFRQVFGAGLFDKRRGTKNLRERSVDVADEAIQAAHSTRKLTEPVSTAPAEFG